MVTDEQLRIIALRDQMRLFASAYSALDQLLQQVHECLVNTSIDPQEAQRIYWTTWYTHRELQTANVMQVQEITKRAHDERRRLYDAWVVCEFEKDEKRR